MTLSDLIYTIHLNSSTYHFWSTHQDITYKDHCFISHF